MKRVLSLSILLAVLAAGCEDNQNPTTSSSDSLTTVHTFVAQLSPAGEVPPVTNAQSGGSGTMTMTFILARNEAGAVNSASVRFDGTFSGFPPGMSLTGAHIHTGAAGVVGPVLVSTGITSGQVTLPDGTGTLQTGWLVVPVATANAIIGNPSAYYFNIHTTLNPGGVARGQLMAQ
jgi:hypothetical protein